jgi:hypothetical protein
MTNTFTLELTYTPVDFFEGLFKYNGNDYVVEIENGQVIATASDVADERIASLSQEILEELNVVFLGVQVVRNRPYELSGHRTTRTMPDGSVEVGLSVGATLVAMTGRVDVITRDAAGNVVTDSKRDRIKEQENFAILALKGKKDAVALSLLKSYYAAIKDPEDALIHLYEIKEALSKKFGGETKALSVLNIEPADWNRLKCLANAQPLLRQGRHRGKGVGQLRDATPAELDDARTIARNLIRAYLEQIP